MTEPNYTAPFDGSNYVPQLDDLRLRGQLKRVFDVMRDSQWRVLTEIQEATGDPAASISAQLRHLRKPKFGAYIVEKRHRGEPAHGLWEYRLVSP